MNHDIDTTSTVQVNAALAYVNRIRSDWVIDWKSCRFYARLMTRRSHT
jgi:hypothetical protein